MAKKLPPAEKCVPFMTYMLPDMKTRAQRMAKKQKRSLSSMIVQAVAEYLTRNK